MFKHISPFKWLRICKRPLSRSLLPPLAYCRHTRCMSVRYLLSLTYKPYAKRWKTYYFRCCWHTKCMSNCYFLISFWNLNFFVITDIHFVCQQWRASGSHFHHFCLLAFPWILLANLQGEWHQQAIARSVMSSTLARNQKTQRSKQFERWSLEPKMATELLKQCHGSDHVFISCFWSNSKLHHKFKPKLLLFSLL